MSYVSTSWKHHPEMIRLHELTKTKLAFPHTREERIVEVKALIFTYPTESIEVAYCNCVLSSLETLTDKAYHEHIVLFDYLEKGFTKPLPELRHPEHMNFYIWEAVLVDLATCVTLKLVSPDLEKRALSIHKRITKGNGFDYVLRKQACGIEQEVETHRKELDDHYDKEDKERGDYPEGKMGELVVGNTPPHNRQILKTTDGSWKQVSDLEIGDELLASNGTETAVVGIYSDSQEMNLKHWESIMADLVDLSGVVNVLLQIEAQSITQAIFTTGLFGPVLRQRAINVYKELKKYETQLKEIRNRQK